MYPIHNSALVLATHSVLITYLHTHRPGYNLHVPCVCHLRRFLGARRQRMEISHFVMQQTVIASLTICQVVSLGYTINSCDKCLAGFRASGPTESQLLTTARGLTRNCSTVTSFLISCHTRTWKWPDRHPCCYHSCFLHCPLSFSTQ